MHRNISLPPEWQTVALVCPKCKAQLRARHNPNNHALEALRCVRCAWSENYLKVAAQRKARFARLRRALAPTSSKQTKIPS